MTGTSRPNIAAIEIDLDAVVSNARLARAEAPGARMMAMVKANAYGHGAVDVSLALADEADAFGVARVAEALELRTAGIRTPIALMEGVLDTEELAAAIEHSLDVVVHSPGTWDLVKDTNLKVWLKVDTGMNRLGLREGEYRALRDVVPRDRLIGVMTHFARADDEDLAYSLDQVSQLKAIVGEDDVDISIPNSAAILSHIATDSTWIRPGIMLYGATTFDDEAPPSVAQLQPAMIFTAPVVAVHDVLAGETVGYGGTFRAAVDTRVAVIAAGYADGYPREVNRPPVSINGQRRTLVGRVSMDMVTVELEPGDVVVPGDRAELWGNAVSIDEVARSAGTIAYTLMCHVSTRVERRIRETS